jgi:outer membrane protein assembly factor BamB
MASFRNALRPLLSLVLCLPFLAGCDTINDWFGVNDEPPLPGTRIAVIEGNTGLAPDPEVAERQIVLPEPYVNGGWPQAGGSTAHAMYHLALSENPQRIWSVGIGDGNDDDAAILAQPIVVGDTIFTMDSRANVSARRQSDGGAFWEVDLQPEDDDEGFFGGGLGFDEGTLYVTTGFGKVYALDGSSGAIKWERLLPAPFRSAPTISGGRVFVVTLDNQSFALAAADGRVLWDHTGIQEPASILGTASPAVSGSVVIVPYTSGEVFALQVENGRVIWSDSLAAVRRTDPLSDIAQVRGLPVIDRGLVFIVSHAGRTAAIDIRRGNRIWERDLGGTETPWAAGEFIYLVTNDAELVCLTREEGAVRWVTALPQYQDPEDKEDIITWYGPLLASDRLIVAGSHGEAYAVSPYDGKIIGVIDLPSGAAITPVLANNTLYFVSADADLEALR